MVKTIYFEDHGQDFLEWDIEIQEQSEHGIGEITDSRPCKQIWVGLPVFDIMNLKKGDKVKFFNKNGKTDTQRFGSIKYPISKIETLNQKK